MFEKKHNKKCNMCIHARATQRCIDPAKRMALVDEYVKAMKTVRQRNMVNRETKLAWRGAADPLPSNCQCD